MMIYAQEQTTVLVLADILFLDVGHMPLIQTWFSYEIIHVAHFVKKKKWSSVLKVKKTLNLYFRYY